jgi:general stress protein 26
MSDAPSAREKLWGMIERHRFAMLTTQEEGGLLRSRPMTAIARDDDGALWFFARSDSAAAWTLSAHPQVCLSYSDQERMDFVMVAGPAAVVTDAARKRQLWSPAVQAWFPEGPESPHNILIRVTPDHAEYWDSKSSKLVQLFSVAKALATGTTPEDIGEHRSVPAPAGSPARGLRP